MVTDRTAYSALRNGGTFRTVDLGIVINGVREDNSRWVDRRAEWDDLVEQVRQLPGLHDFLEQPGQETLLSAADAGPVVILTASRWRCDALIVRADGVQVVELPTLTAAALADRTADHLAALPGEYEPVDAERSHEERLLSVTEWLWDEVAEPVLTALGHTGTPDGEWPRVWWCPTGLFTLLPLHGAGYHAHADGRTVIDRVVSSYTPTLRALHRARSRGEATGAARLLFVGAPDRPMAEQELLTTALGDALTVLTGEAATVDGVDDAMAAHRWVHLSCPADQDLADPSRAGFVLADGTLTVTRIGEQGRAGEFAFLTACRTATGGPHLPDEAVTAAAALSRAGYRHVVATLWTVDDAVAAELTARVYGRLARDGALWPDDAAQAVHDAVRGLRDEQGLPMGQWLPFTHSGP